MKRLFLFLIGLYQKSFSPYLSGCCRFYPGCSEYFKESLKEHGFFIGCFYGFKRFLRCNPFFKGGYDPVKKAKKKFKYKE